MDVTRQSNKKSVWNLIEIDEKEAGQAMVDIWLMKR